MLRSQHGGQAQSGPTSQKPAEQHPLSRKLQGDKDHFTRAFGNFILVKVNPEAAWQMSEESA